jgi:hypothetical protein
VKAKRRPGLALLASTQSTDAAADWQTKLWDEGIPSIVRGNRESEEDQAEEIDVYVPATAAERARVLLAAELGVRPRQPSVVRWFVAGIAMILLVSAAYLLILLL